jgi:hypothetical protein
MNSKIRNFIKLKIRTLLFNKNAIFLQSCGLYIALSNNHLKDEKNKKGFLT